MTDTREERHGQSALTARYNNVPLKMKGAKRWLLHDRNKVPYYTTGRKRRGPLDGVTDTSRLDTFDNALAALAAALDRFAGLGFALGGGWQGIDLDKLSVNPGHASIPLRGYIERSPSGDGLHAIGYGKKFDPLGSNGSGLEAYCFARYFTVTGIEGRGDIEDLAEIVTTQIAPLHAIANANQYPGRRDALRPSAQTDLDELLDHISDADADSYNEWIRVGMAMHDASEGSELGLAAWDRWSRRSAKWGEGECAAKWRTFSSEGKKSVVGAGTLHFKARAGGYGRTTATEDFAVGPGDCAMYGEFIRAAKPLPMLIRDFMHAGARGVLVGPTGAGKSTLATAESIAIAHPSANEFLGRKIELNGGVLYIAAEAVESVRISLRAYGEWIGVNPDTLPIAVKQSAVPLDNEQAVRDLAGEVLALLSSNGIDEPLRLVVVDTLACSLGDAEENDSTALRGVLAHLSLLQTLLVAPKPGEIQPTVQVVAHPPHGAKRIRGSSSISPAIDFEHWLEAQPVASYLEQRSTNLNAPPPEGLDDILDIPMPVGAPRGLYINKLRGHGATHGLRIQFEQHRQEEWLRREDGTYATVARLGNQPVLDIPPQAAPFPTRATQELPSRTGRERQAERIEHSNIKINERRQTILLRAIRDHGDGFNLRVFVSDNGLGNEDNFRKKVIAVCRDKGWIEVGRGKEAIYKLTRKGAAYLHSIGEDHAQSG
jgi:hypothetical protein